MTIQPDSPHRGRVALILAFAAAGGILLLTAAALFDALTDPEGRGVSPAFASIITTTLGVVVGGLVGYIGGTQQAPNPNGLPEGSSSSVTSSPDAIEEDDAWVDQPPADAAEYKE